jgi:YggT family protein
LRPTRAAVTLRRRFHRQNFMQIIATLFGLIDVVLHLYMWCFIISAILSWLVAFNVINTSNRFIYTVGDVLFRLTEPMLRPIRNILPNFGGIDFSPLIAILVLIFIKDGVMRQIYIWIGG